MARRGSPVDAKAAKKWLRFYAVAIPLASLVGGWCTLLTIAWIAFPEGAVEHFPTIVKGGAAGVAAGWLTWSFRMFRILPALIDDILERGLAFDHGRDVDR